jgi:hypothetical protein
LNELSVLSAGDPISEDGSNFSIRFAVDRNELGRGCLVVAINASFEFIDNDRYHTIDLLDFVSPQFFKVVWANNDLNKAVGIANIDFPNGPVSLPVGKASGGCRRYREKKLELPISCVISRIIGYIPVRIVACERKVSFVLNGVELAGTLIAHRASTGDDIADFVRDFNNGVAGLSGAGNANGKSE